MGRPKTPIIIRIYKNVNKVASGCWEWNKSLFHDGYGQIQEDGRSQRAHRVSYKAFKGAIGEGLLVCHTCDNPKCVNPDHLFLGTASDNAKDMTSKRRCYFNGARNPKAKLCTEEVANIKYLHSNALIPQNEIAAIFNVSEQIIYRICSNKYWADIEARL